MACSTLIDSSIALAFEFQLQVLRQQLLGFEVEIEGPQRRVARGVLQVAVDFQVILPFRPTVLGPGGAHAGVAVDTTATVERKVAALMCHKSQLPDPDAVALRVQDWSRANGELAGLAEGRSAELFRVVQIP